MAKTPKVLFAVGTFAYADAASNPDAMPGFLGCGLVGDNIKPEEKGWSTLIGALKQSNPAKKVYYWNWDVKLDPTKGQLLSDDFLFTPEIQCGAIQNGQGGSFPTYAPGTKAGNAELAPIALAANEPDQKGYCQVYTNGDNSNITRCSGEDMQKGLCTGANECKCLNYNPSVGCIYDVTGCGMWPLGANSGCDAKQSFPYYCFGKKADPSLCSAECKQGTIFAFKDFYKSMATRGYTSATAPLMASDLTFVDEMMEAAGCNHPDVMATEGVARLNNGCPTLTAFHFYSMGCPTASTVDAKIQGFKDKVTAAKSLNQKYNMAGTIVNELGSLKNGDTSCAAADIAHMMSEMFDYLSAGDGKGVISQMTWFNQDQTGGTFDLRLVDDQSELTALGNQYMTSCQKWANAATNSIVV